MKPVSLDAIERARSMITKESPPQAAKADGSFDLEGYLAHYGIKVLRVKPNNGANLYCLKTCVFDPAHTGNEAAIGITADGKLFYQCFHNSCKGRTWKEAREKISGGDSLQSFVIGNGAANAGEAQTPKAPLSPVVVKPSYFYDRDESYEQEYLVETFLPANIIIMVAGSPGSMKTWLTMYLAIMRALGRQFLGYVTKQGECFYFDRENPEDIWHQRLVQQTRERAPDEYFNIVPFWMHPAPPKFLDSYYVELAKAHPGALFIFDSYSKFLPKGYSENTNENAADITNFLRELTSYGVTVILIHHAGKDTSNGIRGAEEILAGVDVAFTLAKEGSRLTLKCVKNRFEANRTTTIEVVTDDDGYVSFKDTSHEDQLRKEARLTEQATTTRGIVNDLILEGKRTSKESVKTAIKERFRVGDHKAREIISHALSRNLLRYDGPSRSLCGVVDPSPPKGGVTSPTSPLCLGQSSEGHVTTQEHTECLTNCNHNDNVFASTANRQVPTGVTDDDEPAFPPEDDFPEINDPDTDLLEDWYDRDDNS